MRELKVAVCEMTSNDDVSSNIADLLGLLHCLDQPSSYQLVSFPENSLYFRLGTEPIAGLAIDDSRLQPLREWSVKNKVCLHLGSVPISRGGRVYNTTVWIDALGKISAVYDKMHLFDVDVEGQKRIRESDVFAHGESPAIVDLEGWRIGASICYDLRFAELYNRYGQAGVDVILVPSAFIVPTGRAHWEILLRARAIENQCYVLAAAQGGQHRNPKGAQPAAVRETYGHSMIVDPWGDKLAEVSTESHPDPRSRILTAVLKKDRIDSVRAQIPMHLHRRLKGT